MSKKKPVFKSYNPDQISLLPPSLEELIPHNHVVRVVRQVVDSLDIDHLLKKYKGGGASSFHPRMMLKILVYGYLSNIYSSRKIEAAVQANIHFMWLAGMQTPDHNTINRFRSERLKGVVKEVFSQVVLLMVDQGLVNIKTIYTDGTKLEANANKYTFVWGKSIQTNKKRIHEQLKQLWRYAETVAKEELMDNNPTTYTQIDTEKVTQTIKSINQALDGKQIDKKVKQKLNYAKNNWPKNMAKYEHQEKTLGTRNSFSKTDPDATFMRLKEDKMQSKDLRAAYNWQLSTSNQCIVNYDLYPNPADTLTLPQHIESYKLLYKCSPNVVVADAGYGSEQNYRYLQQNNIEAYVKYAGFHREQKLKGKADVKKPFAVETLYYNKEQDYYVCPMGQKMENIGEDERITASGYKQQLTKYRAKNCSGCPLRGPCHKAKDNRVVQPSHKLNQLRAQARDKLLSEQGITHRKQRPADVEAVFGNIKQNKKFTRFNLRGREKVTIEAGLIAIAHNLAKMAN